MAAVLAAASYSRGGFSLFLAGSARRVMVPGGITFHLEPGTIQGYIQNHWWQLDYAPNVDPEMVDMLIPQPKAAGNYKNMCISVDQHNRHCQDTLKPEKIETKDWRKRVNMKTFSICVVDNWLAWIQAICSMWTHSDFHIHIFEYLIDNTFD